MSPQHCRWDARASSRSRSTMPDLEVRGGIVVNAASRHEADVAIENGRIVADRS